MPTIPQWCDLVIKYGTTKQLYVITLSIKGYGLLKKSGLFPSRYVQSENNVLNNALGGRGCLYAHAHSHGGRDNSY